MTRAVLDRLDPRTRILSAVAFALATTAALDRPLPLLAAVAAAAGLAIAARLPWRRTLRKLVTLDGFLLLAFASLPFTVPGTVWFSVFGLEASREGCLLAAIYLLKVNAASLALFALVGALDPVVAGRALARLGAPDKLVQLYFFTWRYLDLLGAEYRRLRQTMAARAFRFRTDRHSWRTLGWLFGMLLLRAFDRAERILAAMRCRGFDGRFRSLRAEAGFAGADLAFAVGVGAGLWLLVMTGRG